MAGERIVNRAATEWGPVLEANSEVPVAFGDGRLLLTYAGAPCRIAVEPDIHGAGPIPVGSHSQIIAGMPRLSATFEGKRRYRVIDASRFCRMLAFVDVALPPTENPGHAGSDVHIQEVPDDIADDASRIEHWLALEVMRGNSDNALLKHLRRQEAYCLTGYLLAAPGDCGRLNELSVRYGLSYSHFRRLCHRALGSSVKQRLRAWRAARAMLDLMVGELPVLEVALDNGYSSASHISSDIKKLFGITPRMVRNAHSLLP
ncbi:helix-turn-helix domain-containing protein [Achromobacter xylosoxidans]